MGLWPHHCGYLGHEDLFLCSSVYSCHFLVSPASVRSLLFLSFIGSIFARNVPLVSPVSLRRSQVFLILLFSSLSLHYSLKKAFVSLLAILWNSVFSWIYLFLSPLPFTSLLSWAICKPSSTTLLLAFLFLGNGFGHHFLCSVMNLRP